MFDTFNYNRRKSDKVKIGNVLLGSDYPIRVQSMTNTDTNDTENSVAQSIRIYEAGGEIVRLTAQGVKEAENLKNIKESLINKGYSFPLVADIHFLANAADIAAQYVQKVRVNPGNYIGLVRKSDDYTDEEYQAEYEKIKARFTILLDICKKNNTAIRIGVNHGSLSERMMNRWGDTPRGMVESCLEFLQVCDENDFHNVVISMKASNTLAMVHAVRLLVSEMAKRDMHYPLHLGVTEAGDGEDGRIKSSVGIGALLHDGIGDTVRVSLSEEPEAEIPVAKKLATYIIEKQGHNRIASTVNSDYNFFEYDRRQTSEVLNIGGENVPVVFMNKDGEFATLPDFLLRDNKVYAQDGSVYNVFDATQLGELQSDNLNAKFLKLSYPELNDKILDLLKASSDIVVLLSSNHKNQVGEMRAFFHTLLNKGIKTPVVLCRNYAGDDLETYQIQAAADLGVMFLDGFGDGIFLEYTNALAPNKIRTEQLNAIAFGILQASRVRVSKTEYISCPGCGRTLFQLQTVIAKVKAATSHLKGLKIAVMGCIVNGPGEMADADYGYVGAGRGKVSLYKKKECLERNIDENEAVAKLIDLIKANGDWHD
ncbi:MAG: 4-hydroxy-3-methylbut-2-en-1-yl diphosphate synthase [Bacteroidales bacterium 36-12]|nr:MAG: 4-hydroxy-3-methylbut-2-en-1-yl diphosphate synthase [Bacteroidales bacterium 36-12]